MSHTFNFMKTTLHKHFVSNKTQVETKQEREAGSEGKNKFHAKTNDFSSVCVPEQDSSASFLNHILTLAKD